MFYNEDNAAIKLSLDELCETAMGFGSLGTHNADITESTRQNVRDKLARELGIFFTPDKELCFTCSVSGLHYEVSTKVDGVLKKDGELAIYVLKSAKTRSNPVLEAKSLCSALFAASEYDAESIKLRTVSVSTDNKKIRITEKEYNTSVLSRQFMWLIIKIERFAKLCVNKATSAHDSLTAIRFPFKSMREGQRELIEECYRTIHDGRRLFAVAPTGIGKTISVLYPSVKALGAGLCDKIFYLTAKASTRREAFSAVKKMFEAGASLQAIILNSKEQMCSLPDVKAIGGRVSAFCTPGRCDKAKGYYSRSRDALYELLTSANGYTPALVTETARKYNVCPYELSLDLSEHCDIIICDYNYVFDPAVSLRRYFGELSDKKGENYVFLTDEAHNLADRARDMYSAEIDLRLFETHYSVIPKDEKKLNSAFEDVMRAFYALKKYCSDNMTKDESGNERGFYFSTSPLKTFSEKLQKFTVSLELYSKRHSGEPLCDSLSELLVEIKAYLSALDYYDEHFRTYILVEGGNITAKIYCIDPSGVLNEKMNLARASVLFSATLAPTDYFVDILGGAEKAVKLSLPSPFPRENLSVTAVTNISTRHEDREKSASKVAVTIGAAVLPKKGNYIVYFPSYSYMEDVAKHFTHKFPAVNILVQKRGMTHAEKETFLNFFGADSGILRIGFCVLGGSFSEGVDLPGSRLIGSIIVGVGLPQLSNELNIIRDFYDFKYECGYDYAYTYPGMNKVLQASGRVIRRETDKGIVVLIDDRYATPQYKMLFPEHWDKINFASSPSELAKIAEDFWTNANNV